MPKRTKTRPNVTAALDALARGYTPIPIRDGSKNPHISAWPHRRWDRDKPQEMAEEFEQWAEEGASGVGLLLGAPSGGLVDIDLDHPTALRLRDHFLPPTPMRTGRVSRPLSHQWYVVEGDALPTNRAYKMPDKSVSVELRSTGQQTVVPPSVHPSGEPVRWEGQAWGGKRGPAVVDGNKLAVQVAVLGLGAVLVDNWPAKGSRHEAYLALAGGLLRFGNDVHPWWEEALPGLIGALADATHDDDGPETRIAETMASTLDRLRSGEATTGFPRLAEFIGNDHSEQARRLAREVESLAGWTPEPTVDLSALEVERVETNALPPEERSPMEERLASWEPVDLEPYLAGEVAVPQPRILRRSDGAGLIYEGRINSIYGRSEAAKSWIALMAAQQEMTMGERVMYLDFEDEPIGTLTRLKQLGVGDDDIRTLFTYVHPEDPLAMMQRNRWGSDTVTAAGRANQEIFDAALNRKDPTLIIVDGMTMLYGLHGLDTNDAASTDIITSWLKRLTRNGRSTVIVIDHTGKGAAEGDSPIGAHHKVAMIQGAALQAHPKSQPMPGGLGTVKLIVFKDRPGAVRAISGRTEHPTAAVVTMDSRQDGMVLTSIDPPDPTVIEAQFGEKELRKAEAHAAKVAEAREKQRRTDRLTAILHDVLQDEPGIGGPALIDRVQVQFENDHPDDDPPTEGEIEKIRGDEVEVGVVRMEGKTRWVRYYSTLAEVQS